MGDASGRADARTIAVYDEQAEEYAAMSDQANADDPRLQVFIDAVGDGGRVLDLGCGPGASAGVMAEAGLVVDAVDASSSMVALASTRSGVAARQAEFADLDAVGLYDGVWANFSLLHAPKRDMPVHLAAVRRALVPGGVFVLTLKLGSEERVDRLGRFYCDYLDDEIDALLADAGFEVTDRWSGSGAGLEGSVADWIGRSAHT